MRGMTRFRVRHAPQMEEIAAGHAISDKYFTVDTADHETIDAWIEKNPHYLTFLYGDEALAGFIGILPLTQECGEMFDRQEILEEDLTADLVLPREVTAYAQYLYITAIAVSDVNSFRGR